MLLLHNLHPVPVESRVQQTLAEMDAYLQSGGASVPLVSLQEGVAMVRPSAGAASVPAAKLDDEQARLELGQPLAAAQRHRRPKRRAM